MIECTGKHDYIEKYEFDKNGVKHLVLICKNCPHRERHEMDLLFIIDEKPSDPIYEEFEQEEALLRGEIE